MLKYGVWGSLLDTCVVPEWTLVFLELYSIHRLHFFFLLELNKWFSYAVPPFIERYLDEEM